MPSVVPGSFCQLRFRWQKPAIPVVKCCYKEQMKALRRASRLARLSLSPRRTQVCLDHSCTECLAIAGRSHSLAKSRGFLSLYILNCLRSVRTHRKYELSSGPGTPKS
jgi:hypothetical protein